MENYYENFTNDYNWSIQYTHLITNEIYNFCGLKIINLKDTQGNDTIDRQVGLDFILTVETKTKKIITFKINSKLRRYKYYNNFKKDKKILIEINDRNKVGWIEHDGVIIMYCFASEIGVSLACKPIFFKIDTDVRGNIKKKIFKKELILRKSYDGTEFILDNYRSYANNFNEYIDNLNGIKQLDLSYFEQ